MIVWKAINNYILIIAGGLLLSSSAHSSINSIQDLEDDPYFYSDYNKSILIKQIADDMRYDKDFWNNVSTGISNFWEEQSEIMKREKRQRKRRR